MKIIIAATFISLAIVFHALCGRYEFAATESEHFVRIHRIDRLTGTVLSCVGHRCITLLKPAKLEFFRGEEPAPPPPPPPSPLPFVPPDVPR